MMGASTRMSATSGSQRMRRGRTSLFYQCETGRKWAIDPLLLGLIEPTRGVGKSLVLNQHLIDDATEVGAIAAIAGGPHGICDIRDAHRLGRVGQHIANHLGEAPVV